LLVRPLWEGSETIATKLPEELVAGTSELPRAEIKGMRIVVDHAYHGIDYERVWRTLQDDVPELRRVVGRWVAHGLGHRLGEVGEQEHGRQRGPDLGLGL